MSVATMWITVPCRRPVPGRTDSRPGSAGHATFGDFDVEIHEVTADGNRIWFRWALIGKHVGRFAGVEPTGSEIRLEGLNLEVVNGGQIVEHFSSFDRMGLAQLS